MVDGGEVGGGEFRRKRKEWTVDACQINADPPVQTRVPRSIVGLGWLHFTPLFILLLTLRCIH